MERKTPLSRKKVKTFPQTSSKTKPSQVMQGELLVHRDGFGFVLATKKGEEDVFVPARKIGDAIHGDTVEVSVIESRDGRFEGAILRVIEHKLKQCIGRIEGRGEVFSALPDDPRLRRNILIPKQKLRGARHGQYAVIQILRYPHGDVAMQGEVVEILGRRGDLDTELKAVIIHHHLPQQFPQAVLDEAEQSVMSREAYEHRMDLRHLPFVTIDGETAKDFDDAVAVERLDHGMFRLWVAIADVSHFVRTGTALDREAFQRGTSVYFPSACLPMLPEMLSNDLCSLRPDKDRFTLTARLDIDHQGKTVQSAFYTSVIRSRRRLTYTQIKQVLLDRDQKTLHALKPLVPSITLMKECFDRLAERRKARGALDFDLPEPLILMDLEGGIDTIIKAERHVGHMMIEEFMIAANEAVALFLSESKRSCIYRVHDAPAREKMREWQTMLHNLGLQMHFSTPVKPKELAKAIQRVHHTPQERLVNHLLLRSMAKAVYDVENLGHYGLALEYYCHFTSPIRRYPDLVVHRSLKQALQSSRRSGAKDHQKRGSDVSLKQVAVWCSQRERVAMEAERETAKLYATLYMKEHVGSSYDGVVSHVTKFGCFVELIDVFIEGFISLDLLPPDTYHFDEKNMMLKGRKKHHVKLGDFVKITVADVNIERREILFSYGGDGRKRPGRGRELA